MLLAGLRKLFGYFIFSSLFIALCAVAMAFQTAHLFGLQHLPLFYGFVACGTVCSYNTHWAFTPKLFQNPMPGKTGLDQIPVPVHLALAFAALAGALLFFVWLWPHWFWLAGAILLSALYTAPKIPLPITTFLKKKAYGKTIFLTLAWTYITAVLPFLLTDTAMQASDLLFCVNRFYLIYPICILFDLRDRESDQKEGIKSMITEFPLPAIDVIYWGSLAVYFATSLLLLSYFPIAVVLAFLLPGAVLAAGYGWFKIQDADWVYNFALDGLMVISLPLLLLFRI